MGVMEFDEPRAEIAAVVFCPVCSTNDEMQDGQRDLTCNNCTSWFALEHVEEVPDDRQFEGTIIFCPDPHCSHYMDAPSLGCRNFTCALCGQEFSVELDEDVVAEHSMY